MQMGSGDLPNVQRSRRLRRELQTNVRFMVEATIYGVGEAESYGFATNDILDEAQKDIAALQHQLEWAKDEIEKYRQEDVSPPS